MNLSSTCALACFRSDRLGLDHLLSDKPYDQRPKTEVITIGMSSSSGSDISLLYDVNDLRVSAEADSKLVFFSQSMFARMSLCTLREARSLPKSLVEPDGIEPTT